MVCDAPCHGRQYHDVIGDSYIKGDPKVRSLEELITKFAKNDINLYGVRINGTTDKMFKIMSDEYQKISMKPLHYVELETQLENLDSLLL